MPKDLNARVRELAESMRQLAVEIDARARQAGPQRTGFANDYVMILIAQDLDELAMRMDVSAREMSA
jgi:hypothetical protein